MNALLSLLSVLVFTPDVTKEDVKKLVASGVSENAIVSFIRSHGPTTPLSSDDLVDLRRAKVGEKIILAMLETSRMPPGSTVAAPGTDYTSAWIDDTSWYSPYGYYYGSYFWPYLGWYVGPGYRHHWHVPFGYRWGPNRHYPYPAYVHPRATPPRSPAVVPHSSPRGGGKH